MSDVVNSIGLFVDIIGVLIVFFFSPSHFMDFDGGTFDGTLTETELKKKKDEKQMRFGLIIIVLGFIFQFASNFM